jgi:MFS family permease
MGWHGSALTMGSAIGAPIIGLGLDHGGWAWGFGLAGLVGLAIALPGLVLSRRGRSADEPPTVEEVTARGDAQQATDAPLGI